MDCVLYDLRAADGGAFSPYCWRVRMALAHKGLRPELRQVRFTDIARIPHDVRTVPVLVRGDTVLRDSWDIAAVLDDLFPATPPLWPTPADRHLARFMQHWTATQVHPLVFRSLAADIWDRLDPADQPYFRASREQRLAGASLESLRAHQGATIAQLRSALQPLRALVQEQPFVHGAAPGYGDYIVFGAFQWARVISPAALLEPGDAVRAWFERCLDLHQSLGRRERAAPGA